MGSLKYRKGKEYESYLVNAPKQKVTVTKKAIKETFGNQVSVRVLKAPKYTGGGWDLFTIPDERNWHTLRKKR